MTNFTHTYALFTYLCGDMQWSSVGENNAAVVGFNAMGEFFENHPQSGTQKIADAVSCGELRQRGDIDPLITIFQIPTEDCDNLTKPSKRLLCHCKSRLANDISFDVNEVVKQLYPCPPTLQQAIADTGRFIRQNDNSCYVSGKTVSINNTSFTQQCCYHEG